MKRYLQKNVETEAAKLILEGNVGSGDTILIDNVDGKLTARIKQHLREAVSYTHLPTQKISE